MVLCAPRAEREGRGESEHHEPTPGDADPSAMVLCGRDADPSAVGAVRGLAQSGRAVGTGLAQSGRAVGSPSATSR